MDNVNIYGTKQGNSTSITVKLAKLVFYTVLSFFINASLYAQDPSQVDSLHNALLTNIAIKEKVEIRNQLLEIYSYSDSAKTFAQLDTILVLAQPLNYHEAISDAYYNTAWLVLDYGNYPFAIDLFNKALNSALKVSYKKGEGNAYNGLAVGFDYEGNYPAALKYHLLALKSREEAGNTKGVASSYNNIGFIYVAQENYNLALDYFLKSLKLYEEMGDSSSTASPSNNIGHIYLDQGDPIKALEYFFKSLGTYTNAGNINGMAASYVNIGNAYFLQGDYDKAVAYQKKGLKSYEEINSISGSTYPLIALGKVYLAQKNYTKAVGFLNRAMATARDVGLAQNVRDGAELLSQAYKGQKNYKQALKSYELFKTMADSLKNEESVKKITTQAMQYEFDKRQAAAEAEAQQKELIQHQKLQEQKYYTYASGAGIIAFLLIAIIAYKSYRQKKKDNELLAFQNEEIRQQAEEITAQRDDLEAKNKEIEKEKNKSERLLLNILPQETARELKETGRATPKAYNKVSVLFTDFKGFTQIAEKLTEEEVVLNLDYCFKNFDRIIKKHGLEKIKTIGDAYMCAGGIPIANDTNPIDTVSAAREMMEFMNTWISEKEAKGEEAWRLRLGIHTGKVVAGVVGEDKFAYDIWGDAVNIASRMESSGEADKINISGDTYELVKNYFKCTHRGKVKAKNKGEIDMYFVDSPL